MVAFAADIVQPCWEPCCCARHRSWSYVKLTPAIFLWQRIHQIVVTVSKILHCWDLVCMKSCFCHCGPSSLILHRLFIILDEWIGLTTSALWHLFSLGVFPCNIHAKSYWLSHWLGSLTLLPEISNAASGGSEWWPKPWTVLLCSKPNHKASNFYQKYSTWSYKTISNGSLMRFMIQTLLGLPYFTTWQCVKTNSTPSVHIKIAGIHGCSSP